MSICRINIFPGVIPPLTGEGKREGRKKGRDGKEKGRR
jgi:hypothetical protein